MSFDNDVEQVIHGIITDDTVEDIDISGILNPDEDNVHSSVLVPLKQDFIIHHSGSRPLLNGQLEFFSSKEERMQATESHLAVNIASKKAAQKRMRIIILVDIVLFIAILGVVYPSLHKLQTSAKLAGYRFSLSSHFEHKSAAWNIVAKIEQQAQSVQENTEFTVSIDYQEKPLLQEKRFLPSVDSPISYALFHIPYRALLMTHGKAKAGGYKIKKPSGLDITIQVGQEQKKLFVRIPVSSLSEDSEMYSIRENKIKPEADSGISIPN